MTKMTYVSALTNAIALLEAHAGDGSIEDFDVTETIEKLTALKAQTEKRNSADRKPTAKQVANEGLKARVLEVLTSEPATVTELMGRDPELSVLSNQKVSALVNALVDEGRAVKTPVKRVNKFSRA